MINYGIVYGLSDYGLADRLNITREEAKAFIDAYLERFSAVHAFMTSTIEQAKEQGHVTTLFGRRRQIPELRARNWQVRSLGERLAVNTVIQGTAADVMKLAMIGTHRALAGVRPADAAHPHDPRRAALRGPGGGDGAGPRARRARDGRALGPARAAARRRVGRGPDLAGGQVGVDRTTAVVLTAVRRRPHRAAGADQLAPRQAAGTFQGALLSFLIGTAALVVVAALAKGGLGQVADARGLSWYWFLGGLLGAIYVCTVLVTVRTLGAGGVTAATIAAQLTMSVVVDQFGLLGVEKAPVTAAKLAGIVLLAVGRRARRARLSATTPARAPRARRAARPGRLRARTRAARCRGSGRRTSAGSAGGPSPGRSAP